MAPPLQGQSLILTNERGDHDDHTRWVDSAMPHDRHGDGSAGEGHVAHVERSSGESRQGNADDHSRACARRVEPYPPTQCTCDGLRPGGLRCDAGEGWRTGNTDTGTGLL